MEEKGDAAHRPNVVPSLAYEPSSRAHVLQGDALAGVPRRQLFPRQTGDLRGHDMTYLDVARDESNAEEGVATGLLRATSRLAVIKVVTMIKITPFKSFKPGAWSTLHEIRASAERHKIPLHERAVQILRMEGIKGIYRRTVPFYVGNSIGSVVLFGIYGAGCSHHLTVSRTPYPMEHLPIHRWLYHQMGVQRDVVGAAAVAGFAHGLIIVPCSLWVAMHLDRPLGPALGLKGPASGLNAAENPRQRLLAELRQLGVRRVAAVALRDAVSFSLFFSVFEGTKQATRRMWERLFTRWYRVEDPALWTVGSTALGAGAGAGMAHALANLTLTHALGLHTLPARANGELSVLQHHPAPRMPTMRRGELLTRVMWASIPNALSFLALELIFYEIGLTKYLD